MTYYKRDIEQELHRWKNDKERHPLLIRGARQVGKSSVVRNLHCPNWLRLVLVALPPCFCIPFRLANFYMQPMPMYYGTQLLMLRLKDHYLSPFITKRSIYISVF